MAFLTAACQGRSCCTHTCTYTQNTHTQGLWPPLGVNAGEQLRASVERSNPTTTLTATETQRRVRCCVSSQLSNHILQKIQCVTNNKIQIRGLLHGLRRLYGPSECQNIIHEIYGKSLSATACLMSARFESGLQRERTLSCSGSKTGRKCETLALCCLLATVPFCIFLAQSLLQWSRDNQNHSFYLTSA